MPFSPGERLDWIPAHTDPAGTVFVLFDLDETPLLTLSTANGGLEQRRKGALHPVFNAPAHPGKYRYEWRVNGEPAGTGHVRVQRQSPPAPHRVEPEAPEYTGPGSGRRGI